MGVGGGGGKGMILWQLVAKWARTHEQLDTYWAVDCDNDGRVAY